MCVGCGGSDPIFALRRYQDVSPKICSVPRHRPITIEGGSAPVFVLGSHDGMLLQ